jgi:hypothetical protein
MPPSGRTAPSAEPVNRQLASQLEPTSRSLSIRVHIFSSFLKPYVSGFRQIFQGRWKNGFSIYVGCTSRSGDHFYAGTVSC